MAKSTAPTDLLRSRGWVVAAASLETHPTWQRSDRLTVDEAEVVLGRVGRNGAPAVLFDLFYSGCLGSDAMPALVAQTWSRAEWPASNVPRRIWIEWFRLAAYAASADPLTVYRGATPRFARGMSWTIDRAKAQWFGDRWTLVTGKVAHVYTVTAPADAILADIDLIEGGGGRHEAEIVVDPVMLPKVRRADPR